MEVLNKLSTLVIKSYFLGTLSLGVGVVSASSDEFPGAATCRVSKISGEATLSKTCRQDLGDIEGKRIINVNLYVGGRHTDENIIGFDYNRYVGLRFYRNNIAIKQYRDGIPKKYISEDVKYKFWSYTYDKRYEFTTSEGKHNYYLEASTTARLRGSFRIEMDTW